MTKYRKQAFDAAALRYLREVFECVCQDFDVELTEFNGGQEHVHLLVHYSAQVQFSKLVNRLKGVSSRQLRQTRPDLATGYYRGALWSPSYFAASCGGAPLEIIRQYVEQQQTPR